jgi:lipoate-protein ligase A
MKASETWRFIESGFLDGQSNMAIDEAIARISDENDGSAVPALRTYGWHPYTISLGYHQSLDDIDVVKCRNDGIAVVHRPTGGRAILHAEELTYSVVIPKHSIFYHDSIIKVYEIISKAIVAGLNQIGIDVKFDRATFTPKNFSKGKMSMLCYASSVQHEIGANGRKLVGSAQRRIGNTILQHGSILIGPEHLRLVDYLAKPREYKKSALLLMQNKTTFLNELLEKDTHFKEIQAALLQGFQEELGVELVEEELIESEKELADNLKTLRSDG